MLMIKWLKIRSEGGWKRLRQEVQEEFLGEAFYFRAGDEQVTEFAPWLARTTFEQLIHIRFAYN
jgi:hypothetical protein